jgi:DNA-binding MarR family transcriptional regulator
MSLRIWLANFTSRTNSQTRSKSFPRERVNGMPDSYPFPVYSGIFEPKHYKQIGSAIWFFLWCIKSITEESEDAEGVTWGHVYRGAPLKQPDLAEPFGVDSKTVSRWIKTLEEHGYLKVTRAPHGLILAVHNSKKYRKRSDKYVRTDEGDKTYLSDQTVSDQTELPDHRDKNVRSNKDIIKTLIDRLIDGLNDPRLTDARCGVLTTVVSSFSPKEIHLDEASIAERCRRIESYYLKRKSSLMSTGVDWTPINQLAKMKIPIEFIEFGIDLAFARHEKTKRWPTDNINQFSYCYKVIIGTWNRLLSDIAVSETPAETSIIPISQASRRTAKQRELDELRRKAKEARERERGGNP